MKKPVDTGLIVPRTRRKRPTTISHFDAIKGYSFLNPVTLSSSAYFSLICILSTASAKSHFSNISVSLGSASFLIDRVFFMLSPDLSLMLETPSFVAADTVFNSASIFDSSSEFSAWSSSAAAS